MPCSEFDATILISDTGRPGDVPFALNQQMSFLVENLDELRTIRDRVIAAGIENIRIRTHGNAWSIYFRDPEENQIETYVHTPWYIPQPHGVTFDLDQSNDEIYRWTEAHCRADPGFMTADQREKEMAGLMAAVR